MISKETFTLVYDISFYLNIICLVAGLLFIKFQARKDIVLLIYITFSVMFDFMADKFVLWFDLSTNYHILNTWSFVEFLVLFYFFLQIDELKKYKRQLYIFLFLFLVTCTVVLTFYKSIYELINVHKLYSAFFFSAISIVLFYRFLQSLKNNLLRTSLFWQNTGVFIYFTGNIMIFLMIDYLFSGDLEFSRTAWLIHNFLTIIKTLCILFAFVVNKKYASINQ